MAKETLYDVWARRNPRFETCFEDTLLRQFTEYGGGSVESMSSKGKIFGAGYELYIYAFFIGLYANKQQELAGDTKILGQPIQFWGNFGIIHQIIFKSSEIKRPRNSDCTNRIQPICIHHNL